MTGLGKHKGETEVNHQTTHNTTLSSGRSALGSDCSIPRTVPMPIVQGSEWGTRTVRMALKISPPPGFDLLVVQPVSNSYKDYTNRPPINK
jgi:hypothetical protein